MDYKRKKELMMSSISESPGEKKRKQVSRSKLFYTWLSQTSFSPGFNWLTMQLTTKATKKSRETKDLEKTNVTFSILPFPLPGTFFFYSTSRIQFETHLLQNAFQTTPPPPPPRGIKLSLPYRMKRNTLLLQSLSHSSISIMISVFGFGWPQVWKVSGAIPWQLLEKVGVVLSKGTMLHVCSSELVERIMWHHLSKYDLFQSCAEWEFCVLLIKRRVACPAPTLIKL